MRVLAIDPGYERVGSAIVERVSGKDILIDSNCFRTHPKDDFPTRLNDLGEEIKRLITLYKPGALAIEQLYFNNNQKTAMYVSEAKGVITYLCKNNGLLIFEYTPSQIKNAVSGYGKSTKAQIAKMVTALVVITKEIKFDDEYDAIAIGLTCLASERLP